MNPKQKYINSVGKASPFSNAPTRKASPFSNAPSVNPSMPVNTQVAMTGVANSPSAVGPGTQSVMRPTNAQNSVAKQAFMEQMSSPQGLSEQNVRNNLSAFNNSQVPSVQPINQPMAQSMPQSMAQPQATETPVNAQGNPKDSFLKAYRDYLSKYSESVRPSSDMESAALASSDIQGKIEERNLKARQTFEEKLDQPGMLRAGAQEDATRFMRRENSDLANLAVQGSAADRRLQALTGSQEARINAARTMMELSKPIQIGNQFIDPTTGDVISSEGEEAGFTLSPGQIRYDSSGNQIASGGSKPMSAAQEEDAIKKQNNDTQVQQTATQSLGIINNLLNTDRYKSISGGMQSGSVPFFGDRSAVAEYDQLQGLLKLGVRGLMKGQGSVSDYEGKVLGQAASSLSRLTGEAQMKEALQKVRGVIKTNNGQTTSVTVTNPENGEKITAELSGPEIYNLVVENNTITYN